MEHCYSNVVGWVCLATSYYYPYLRLEMYHSKYDGAPIQFGSWRQLLVRCNTNMRFLRFTYSNCVPVHLIWEWWMVRLWVCTFSVLIITLGQTHRLHRDVGTAVVSFIIECSSYDRHHGTINAPISSDSRKCMHAQNSHKEKGIASTTYHFALYGYMLNVQNDAWWWQRFTSKY